MPCSPRCPASPRFKDQPATIFYQSVPRIPNPLLAMYNLYVSLQKPSLSLNARSLCARTDTRSILPLLPPNRASLGGETKLNTPKIQRLKLLRFIERRPSRSCAYTVHPSTLENKHAPKMHPPAP